eukprot:CAMPEP_0182574126 /NCGR_PEP_ID=MMETSP1324-20130603/22726_1 /TAXON_ID=236786 /ORGANISM="Florenciella sp., Strain RCC1587" /LENGTH=35 /DNA_ID= /DNA_START= /DNA_END= /DNA_ORIENTATION=
MAFKGEERWVRKGGESEVSGLRFKEARGKDSWGEG